MKKAFYLLLLFSSVSYSTQSLVLAGGLTATATIPDAAPYDTLNAQSFRFQFRVHDWSPGSGGVYSNTVFHDTNASNFFCSIDSSSFLVCADAWDSLSGDYFWSISIAGRTDFIVTVVRDVEAMKFHGAVCNSDLSGCVTSTGQSIVSLSTGRLSSITAGGDNTSARLAFFRWRTGNGAELPREYDPPADLGDWEFENNGNDSSGNSLTLSYSGTATYGTSPIHAPGCNAGASQTLRAGGTGALDGTGSTPADGGSTLSYSWSQIAGPSVTWSSHTTAQPTISNLAATNNPAVASYVFSLTVTDGSNQSSTCTVKDGAVTVDSRDVVIAVDSSVDSIIGPLTPWGTSPWPVYDTLEKSWADMMHAKRVSDPHYADVWNTALTGTVDVVLNSHTITGHGTTFQTTFCNGGTSPTGDAIVVWWSGYGRRAMAIESCDSDTQITTATAYSWWTASESGLHYSALTSDSAYNWSAGQSTAGINYYDGGLSHRALYYRSGIDDYLTEARGLAAAWWSYPYIDRGDSYVMRNGGFWNFGLPPRGKSATGLYLYALDGHPETWPWLRAMLGNFYYFVGIGALGPSAESVREGGYNLAFIALAALYDPDATAKATALAALQQDVDAWISQQWPDGSWRDLFPGAHNSEDDLWRVGAASTVSVTHGATTVIGNGTNWQQSWFASGSTDCNGSPCAHLWTADSGPSHRRPVPLTGDGTIYTATWVSTTQLTLDRPYEGVTDTAKFWGLDSAGAWLGWGTQPFMMGVAARGMAYAYRALSAADDITRANGAKQALVNAVNWIRTHGYQPDVRGMWYGVGYGICGDPPSLSGPSSCIGDRSLSGETMGAIADAYRVAPTSTLLNFGDNLMGAMWGKGSVGPQADGQYLSEFDAGGWWYGPDLATCSGSNPPSNCNNGKWFGFHWGFGGAPAWLGARNPQSSTRNVWVGVHLSDVSNAAKVRVTIAPPVGATQTTCSSSPCLVTVDGQQGEHLMRLEFLSAAGAVLASSDDPIIIH